MEQSPTKKVRIGVLTQPISDKIEPGDLKAPDQYVLNPLKVFLEANGAEVVALRYDLVDEPSILRQSLDSLDGVLFTGGFLQIKVFSKMPTITRTYYKTATEVFKYVMEAKLPLFAICQGFQLLLQITVDLFEPQWSDAQLRQTGQNDDVGKHHKLDNLLSDLKIFRQYRTTKWVVERPIQFSVLKKVPEELMESMKTEQLIRHYHNWAVTSANFNACRSLVNFWDVIGVDDGLHQDHVENEGMHWEEFPTVIQAKNYPMHAWLTHPEEPFTTIFETPDLDTDDSDHVLEDGELYQKMPDLQNSSEKREKISLLAISLSEGFVNLCREFREGKGPNQSEDETGPEMGMGTSFMRNMLPERPRGFYVKAWSVTSLKFLR